MVPPHNEAEAGVRAFPDHAKLAAGYLRCRRGKARAHVIACEIVEGAWRFAGTDDFT
jgi:hypothetical protein